ncbi:hypothetical protein F2Q68_00024502, partial [Brassica cretica]
MEVDLGANAFGIDFHPSKNLVAAGLIDGQLHLYRYDTESSLVRERKVRAHKESCRAVRFIDGGQRIVTASADCSILATDVETGASVARLENAHEDAVNTLITVTETTIASGDDKGCVKIWDTRQRSCSHEFNVHEDYISDMTFASDTMKLVATRTSPRFRKIIKNLFCVVDGTSPNPSFLEMEIDLGANAFGIDFHPSKNLVAAGLIDGQLHLYRYDTESSLVRERKVRAHKESCRAVRFIDDGQRIVTASADCSILATDVETGASVARLENAHEDAVNTLITVTETTIASGDDKGCVKIWDTRQRSCSHEFNVHEDYISDMTFVSDTMKLVAT